MRQGSNYDRNEHDIQISSNDKRNVEDIRRDVAQQQAPAPTTQPAPTTGSTTVVQPTDSPYVYDAHFSKQYFLDEQKNRKNPDYVSPDAYIDNATIDAIANAIQGNKTDHPNEWRYGDPGWSSDEALWTEYVQPLEQSYRESQMQKEIVQAQKANDVDYGVNKDDERFGKAYVDTSEANYNKLSGDEKLVNTFTPAAAGTDVANTPWYTKWTQPIISAAASSGGMGKIAKYLTVALGVPTVPGKIAAIGAQAGTGLYSYGKMTGTIKGNKVLDKIIEMTDILDEKSQQFQGALAYAFEKTGGGDLSDGAQFFTNTKFMIDNLGDILHYAFGSGKASTEYAPEVVGAVTGMTANMGATPFTGNLASRIARSLLSLADGKDGYFLNRNEVTRNNLGLPGTYEIDEELMGSNAITFWLDYLQDKYDNGMTDEMDLQYALQKAVTDYYGDLANFSEFLEHEVTDPGNTLDNMDARAINAYAKATGDTNLQIASKANIGTWAGDLTGGIPIVPDVIREIGKLTGHPEWLQTSGGLNEVMSAWDIENLKNDPNQLTARDRRYSGINEDNTVNRFTPNETGTTPVERVLNGVKNFFSETNESRAAFEGDAIFDFINIGIEDAIASRGNEDIQTTINRINTFIDELANPEMISENSPFRDATKSVLYNSIKDDVAQAVKTRRSEIKQHIDAYLNNEVNRQTLNTLASALSMTPQKLLDMYDKDKAKLTQMILNKANENGGRIQRINLDVEGRDFGEQVMQRIKTFTGDKAEAWDLRQLGLQVSTSIADGVTEHLIQKFGIKPDKLIYRFGDTIKKMQNLLLLGLSPSYLANNLLNNVVTRTSLGYGGWMSPKTIGDWMNRFGYKPERFADSLAGEIGQKSQQEGSHYDKLTMTIADKKKMKDGLEKLGKFSSDASQKLGIFGNLSAKVEGLESQQVLASAMMNYMARTWKPGVNFRKMPVQLEQAIEAQCPGMVDTIYAAISSGMNMSEIEKALFGTYVAPSVEDSMKDAARRLGYENSDDIIHEYFIKNGMMDELKQTIQGKQGAEIDRAIDDIKARLKAILSIQWREEIARRAEDIKNKTKEEGFVAAINAAYDSADQWRDIWLNSIDVNTRIFQKRIEEGIPTAEFRAMYQNHQKNLTERWKQVYQRSQQTYDGILKGIGVGDKHRADYMKALKGKNDMWANFYEKTQPEKIQPYLDALNWVEGEDRASWDSRVKKAWADYQDVITKEINKVYEKEADLQKKMDDAYIAGLKEAVGTLKASEIDKNIAPIFEKLRKQRQNIIALTQAVRHEANKTSYLQWKSNAWLGAESKRKDAIELYYNTERDLYTAIETYKPLAENKPAQDTTTPVNHEENIKQDVAQRKAEEAQKQAELESEIASDMIADGATAEQVDAYIKYSPEVGSRFTSPDIFDRIKRIITDGATARQKYEDGKKFIKSFYEIKGYNLQGDIEEKIGRYLSKGEEEIFYWYLKRMTGIEFPISPEREKLFNDTLTLQRTYEMLIGLDPSIDEKFDEIIDGLVQDWGALDDYLNMQGRYYMNRNNLVSIAIRAGADESTANAFSKYFSSVADRWEKNHPGKDFFKETFGVVDFNPSDDPKKRAYATFNPIDKSIEVFNNADFFSFVHEVAHGFQYTLDDSQVNELAKYFGMTPDEYISLRDDYMKHPLEMRDVRKNDFYKWRDCTELFVRGFLDYLTTGEAPTTGLKAIWKAFKNFLEQTFGSTWEQDKWWNKHFANHVPESKYFGTTRIDTLTWGRADYEHNGTTLRKVFDSIFGEQTIEGIDEQARVAQSQADFAEGKPAPVGDIQFDKIAPSPTTKDIEIVKVSGELFDALKDIVYPKDETNAGNMFTPPSLMELMQYLWQKPDEDGKYMSPTRSDEITFMIESIPNEELVQRAKQVRDNVTINAKIPDKGVYVDLCYSFPYGQYTIVAIVYKDGQKVAYVPSALDTWEVKDGDDVHKILGVSPENPEQWVYTEDVAVRTEKVRQDTEGNPYKGEQEIGSMATTDPTGDAHNKFAYENVFDILDEFIEIYKRNLNGNMADFKFSSLDDDTREALRGYVDTDIRNDLMNTKYKTGKFGEMVRDAALLNYNQRYGFDNLLTLLFPYQFWMTRSVMNWVNRMSSKGSRMWRKYYKLKELEKRNKKEYMPSRISGKFGMYIPGLDDWLGGDAFMSTDQLFVVNQFLDPLIKLGKQKNSIIAAAEKYLREEYENGNISREQYLAGMDAQTREKSTEWQMALAKAQMENDSDTGFGGLMENYLGWNLPVSVGKALITGDQTGWNQWPITRTGTAFRAIVGNNWIGKMGENILSAPEKALRNAAKDTFGDTFAYNEFGAFGDYYITQQVFDMVVEGKIDASDAVQATIEKDGNAIWEEAADRQRQETLIKMQGGSVVDAVKKLVKDYRAGDNKEDTIGSDYLYLLTSILTAPMSKTVVRQAEREWREDKGELNKAYEDKENGDKDAINKFYDEHPYATYNNLRYEKDPETMLRQFLYKSIVDKYYDLDKAQQQQYSMSFDPDFDKYVINKDTRAIDAIDLGKLASYAQTLNGKIPYLATDKLNTKNVQPAPVMQVPQTTLDEYNVYRQVRDEKYPGMANVNQIYYSLPAEDRKAFKRYNPKLTEYQQWDKQYKTDHPNVKQYSSLISESYDIEEMENACSLVDAQTMRELTYAARTDSMPDKIYKPIIERLMIQVGTTDTYDNFVKSLKKYILGQ